VTPSKSRFEPNEQLEFELSVSEDNLDSDETVFASVTVTDMSSLFRVPDHLRPPSLPSMVYLERDTNRFETDQLGVFSYWQDYIAPFFDASTKSKDWINNIETLLGVQPYMPEVEGYKRGPETEGRAK